VLQIKTSKIINDMAKVQQKSEKITAFGGIFFVLVTKSREQNKRIHSFFCRDGGTVSKNGACLK
jgi:hypothetical protein